MTGPSIALIALLAAGPPAEAPPPVRPTMVRLDFEDRTLDEIAAELTGRGPFTVEVAPDLPGLGFEPAAKPAPKAPSPRFRVVEPQPLPFWAAMDRIGRASGRWADLDVNDGKTRVLLRKAAPGRGFATNAGAVQVMLDHLAYDRAIRFVPDHYPPRSHPMMGDEPTGERTTFAASMGIAVEPGLTIAHVAPPTLLEATDDRGHSLAPEGPQEQPLLFPPTPDEPRTSAGFEVALRYPADPGPRIRRLRGTIVVRVGGVPGPGPSERDVTVPFDFADIPMP